VAADGAGGRGRAARPTGSTRRASNAGWVGQLARCRAGAAAAHGRAGRGSGRGAEGGGAGKKTRRRGLRKRQREERSHESF
jgi:hypothetical protein